MADILKEILKEIPDSAKICSAVYEGANIVLYSSNREFFIDNNGIIRDLVDKFKKRIEIRIDQSMTMDTEKAEELIKKIIPKEAGELNINFDPQRSQVVIEVEKPGLAIGKSGELLKEIKKLLVELVGKKGK